MKFHIGDRVVMTEKYCGAMPGMVGTVVFAPGEMGDDNFEERYGVDFDDRLDDHKTGLGHRCVTIQCQTGYARQSHGHWIPDYFMNIYNDQKIEIDDSVSFYN